MRNWKRIFFFCLVVVVTVLFHVGCQPTDNNSPGNGGEVGFRITSPTENQVIANELVVRWSGKPDDNNTDIVVFREDGGNWIRVRRIEAAAIDWENDRSMDVTPYRYFCDAQYAIRFMVGGTTIAGGGPVHVDAGAGPCSGDPNDFVYLGEYQVDLEDAADQDARATCGAFAGIAALEALYHRKTGLEVRLSQQYFHHICKGACYGPERYRYENQSSYWGGNDPYNVAYFLSCYAMPPLRLAPYLNEEEMTELLDESHLDIDSLTYTVDPRTSVEQEIVDRFEYYSENIPFIARYNTRYRVKPGAIEEISRADARDPNFLEDLLRQEYEIIFSMNWDSIEPDPNQAKTFRYLGGGGGLHLMLIVGFDKVNSYFLVKNSHGDGIIRIPYIAVQNETVSAAYIKAIRPAGPSYRDWWLGAWSMDHDGWLGRLVLRRHAEDHDLPNPNTDYIRMGEYYAGWEDKSYFVIGRFDPADDKILNFWIDFDTPIQLVNRLILWRENGVPLNAWADVRPCFPDVTVAGYNPVGQKFTLQLNTRTPEEAEGTTVWQGQNFPVRIWRED